MTFDPATYGTPSLIVDPADNSQITLDGSSPANVLTINDKSATGLVFADANAGGSLVTLATEPASGKQMLYGAGRGAPSNAALTAATSLWTGNAARTLAAIYRIDSTINSNSDALVRQDGAGSGGDMVLDDQGGTLYFWRSANGTSLAGSDALDTLHLVVLVADGTTVTLWIDGVLVGTVTDSLASNDVPMSLCGPSGATSYQLGGYLGYVLGYSSALTGDTLASMQADLMTAFEPPPPVVTAPDAPTGLTASIGTSTTEVDLSWTASTGADSYNVERSYDGGTTWAEIATGVAATTYADNAANSISAPTANVPILYAVKAVNAEGTSVASTPAPGWVAADLSAYVLTADAVAAIHAQIAWLTRPEDGGPADILGETGTLNLVSIESAAYASGESDQSGVDIAAVNAKKNKIQVGTTILTVAGTLPAGGGTSGMKEAGMQPVQTIYRNRPGQFIRFYAQDGSGEPVDDIASMITATVKLDNGTAHASQTVHPVGEGGGAYTLPLAQAETQFEFGMVVAFSVSGTGTGAGSVIWAVVPQTLQLSDGK
jgi:hypothetical protein